VRKESLAERSDESAPTLQGSKLWNTSGLATHNNENHVHEILAKADADRIAVTAVWR